MLFFGNSKVAGLYLNIILQVLTLVCIYFDMGFVSNVQVSVLVSGVILLIPFYSDKVYEISSFNLLLLLCAIGFLALAGGFGMPPASAAFRGPIHKPFTALFL